MGVASVLVAPGSRSSSRGTTGELMAGTRSVTGLPSTQAFSAKLMGWKWRKVTGVLLALVTARDTRWRLPVLDETWSTQVRPEDGGLGAATL